MEKRAFLIHGWEGYPEEGWRPWLKDELEKNGFKVIVPAMPDSKHPQMGEWVGHLTKLVGTPDEGCFFVGHSLGCITILRYIESLKSDQAVGGAVLVAGFTSNLGYEELETFFKTPIDWTRINSRCNRFIAIHSDNDPYVSLHYANFFKERLGAKVFVENNMKHFSGDDGISRLPIALSQLLEMANWPSPARAPAKHKAANPVRITYFVHGTTVDNQQDISSGWKDCELSELGIKQSKELTSQTKDKKFDVVICSDLKRAVQSAKLTWDGMYPIVQDKRLRECNYGDLNGAPSDEVEALMEKAIDVPFPHGESYKDVEKRMRDFVKDIGAKYPGKHIAIVAHRAPQLALDVILWGRTWKQAMEEDWRLKKAWKPGWDYSTDR
ncbi:MAG: histidine phosphatase family protein [Nanoarchaeota archaeon]